MNANYSEKCTAGGNPTCFFIGRGKMIRRFALSLTFMAGVSTFTFAQNFVWTMKLKNGEHYSSVAFQNLRNDTLFFLRAANYSDWITVDSLAELRRERRGAILPATLIGSVAGGAIGYAVKPTSENASESNVYGATFGAVFGGVVGYLIGSFVQADEVIDMAKLDHASKLSALRKITSQ